MLFLNVQWSNTIELPRTVFRRGSWHPFFWTQLWDDPILKWKKEEKMTHVQSSDFNTPFHSSLHQWRTSFFTLPLFLQFKDHDWRASEQVKLRVDQKLISNVGNNAGQMSIQNKRLWEVGPTQMPNVFHSFHCILSKASNFFHKVSFC